MRILSPSPPQIVGSAKIRRRGIYTLFFFCLAPLGRETSALGVSGTCAPSPGRRWHGTVKGNQTWCGPGRGSQGVTERHKNGPPGSLLSPPRSEPGVPIKPATLRSCTGLAPKFRFLPIPSYGKTRTNILAYPKHLFCQSVRCLLCAGQPAGHRGGGAMHRQTRHFRSPSAPTIMVEGQGDPLSPCSQVGALCIQGEWGSKDGFSEGFVQMKPEGVS